MSIPKCQTDEENYSTKHKKKNIIKIEKKNNLEFITTVEHFQIPKMSQK